MVPWHPPCALISLIFSSLDPETNCLLLSSYVHLLSPHPPYFRTFGRLENRFPITPFCNWPFFESFLSVQLSRCSFHCHLDFGTCFRFLSASSMPVSVFAFANPENDTGPSSQESSTAFHTTRCASRLPHSLSVHAHVSLLFASLTLFAGLPASLSTVFRFRFALALLCFFPVDRPRLSFRVSASAFSLERR